MSQRTIAIGDIHGCSRALAALLDAIAPAADDTVVTLGDYVDRGPDSRGVIDRLLELAQGCRLVPLLGNHEAMMLAALDHGGEQMYFWLEYGGRETLDSYGGWPDDIPDEHLAFLRRLHPFHETARHIFVHANYDPDLDMPDQPPNLRLWEHLPCPPAESPRGRARRHGGGDEDVPPLQPPPHHSGKTVFVGHTPQLSGRVLDGGHVVCIDTGCAYGGLLTAIDADTRETWQSDADGNLR